MTWMQKTDYYVLFFMSALLVVDAIITVSTQGLPFGGTSVFGAVCAFRLACYIRNDGHY